MAELIESFTQVEAAGTPPKTIREHVGIVNTGDASVSIAHMTTPPGWAEPWQQPDFDEWTHSTPDGADYIAVCLPAFTPDSVHRD